MIEDFCAYMKIKINGKELKEKKMMQTCSSDHSTTVSQLNKMFCYGGEL